MNLSTDSKKLNVLRESCNLIKLHFFSFKHCNRVAHWPVFPKFFFHVKQFMKLVFPMFRFPVTLAGLARGLIYFKDNNLASHRVLFCKIRVVVHIFKSYTFIEIFRTMLNKFLYDFYDLTPMCWTHKFPDTEASLVRK